MRETLYTYISLFTCLFLLYYCAVQITNLSPQVSAYFFYVFRIIYTWTPLNHAVTYRNFLLSADNQMYCTLESATHFPLQPTTEVRNWASVQGNIFPMAVDTTPVTIVCSAVVLVNSAYISGEHFHHRYRHVFGTMVIASGVLNLSLTALIPGTQHHDREIVRSGPAKHFADHHRHSIPQDRTISEIILELGIVLET